MQPWSISEQLPSAADYNRLRDLVGWGTDIHTVRVHRAAHRAAGLGHDIVLVIVASRPPLLHVSWEGS